MREYFTHTLYEWIKNSYQNIEEIEIIYNKIKEVYSTFRMIMNMNKYLLLNNIKDEIQESLKNITIVNTNNQYKYFIV